MLLNILPFAARDFAVDLGTANTVVFAPGRGIVVDEPSIVAINTQSDKTEAVGHAAYAMLGRTPANITTIRPLRDGVIADFEAAERLLSHLIRKAQGSVTWRRTRLVIGIPSSITQVERRAVVDSAYRAKASEVHLVEEPMAAAIGAGLPITEPGGNMVVDIGGGTAEVAVISLAGIVACKSIRVGGDKMDEAIVQHVKRKYNLLIGERTADAAQHARCHFISRPRTSERRHCFRQPCLTSLDCCDLGDVEECHDDASHCRAGHQWRIGRVVRA